MAANQDGGKLTAIVRVQKDVSSHAIKPQDIVLINAKKDYGETSVRTTAQPAEMAVSLTMEHV